MTVNATLFGTVNILSTYCNHFLSVSFTKDYRIKIIGFYCVPTSKIDYQGLMLKRQLVLTTLFVLFAEVIDV